MNQQELPRVFDESVTKASAIFRSHADWDLSSPEQFPGFEGLRSLIDEAKSSREDEEHAVREFTSRVLMEPGMPYGERNAELISQVIHKAAEQAPHSD